MSKRVLAVAFVAFFIGTTVFLLVGGKGPGTLRIGTKMPQIDYVTLSGRSTLMPDSSREIIVIYFNKDCNHCQYELSLLDSNVKSLQNVRIYLLTSEEDFFKTVAPSKWKNLDTSKNVTFGVINKEEYKSKYGTTATPSLYFFNREGRLKDMIIGEVKIDRILQIMSFDVDEHPKSGNN